MKSGLFVLFLLSFSLFVVVSAEGETSESPLRGIITGSMVNLRESGSLQARVLTVMPRGNMVIINGIQDEWVRVKLLDGLEGWVCQKYISTDPMAINSRERFLSRARRISGLALQYLGIKYIYGGASPRGFDCSGFTMFVYAQLGWKLPHNAAAQMGIGAAVGKEELLPGDLVFFRTMNAKRANHVGIYLGGGNFIHAASGYGAVRVSNIDSGYFKYRFCGARRLDNYTANLDFSGRFSRLKRCI